MDVHLITSDPSGFELIDRFGKEVAVTGVIVPSNRLKTHKVEKVFQLANLRNLPVSIHQLRNSFDNSLPSSPAAISWLYSQIICASDLEKYSKGVLNMHGGKIPEYRGANVMHWAIINGEKELGITWHEMVSEVDAGPIYAETCIPIPREMSALEIRGKMIEKGIALFPRAWSNFLDKKARMPDLSSGKRWPPRSAADGEIGEHWPEEMVRNLVRALCPPWPSAYIKTITGIVPITGVVLDRQRNSIPYLTKEGRYIFLIREATTSGLRVT